jgi:exosome complex RNA-binding protein Rrp4
MTGKGEEDNYTELFSSVINNIEAYNSVEQQTKRINYALENTYEKNIQKINQFLQ